MRCRPATRDGCSGEVSLHRRPKTLCDGPVWNTWHTLPGPVSHVLIWWAFKISDGRGPLCSKLLFLNLPKNPRMHFIGTMICVFYFFYHMFNDYAFSNVFPNIQKNIRSSSQFYNVVLCFPISNFVAKVTTADQKMDRAMALKSRRYVETRAGPKKSPRPARQAKWTSWRSRDGFGRGPEVT